MIKLHVSHMFVLSSMQNISAWKVVGEFRVCEGILGYFAQNKHSNVSNSRGFPGGASGKEPACQCRQTVIDAGSVPGSGRSPGEGLDNPLQYSCLENPMDRGAWQAVVYGITKSQTPLSDWAIPSLREPEGLRWFLKPCSGGERSSSKHCPLREVFSKYIQVLNSRYYTLSGKRTPCATWCFNFS